MLILGDGVPEEVYYENETRFENINLRSLSSAEFADMVAADGAVLIEPADGVTAMGALGTDLQRSDGKGVVRPEGSRHSSAAPFSELAPNHMVFVVSENRMLTVMANGTAVIDRR